MRWEEEGREEEGEERTRGGYVLETRSQHHRMVVKQINCIGFPAVPIPVGFRGLKMAPILSKRATPRGAQASCKMTAKAP
eukprot:2321600-Pyramimonas_sp.AAC.1